MKEYEKISSDIATFEIENDAKSTQKTRKLPCGNMHSKKTYKNVLNSSVVKKQRFDRLKPVCWIIIPVITVVLLVLDALGIYIFNVERLIVLGIWLLIILLPFFSEITIKDISIKCNDTKSNTDA